MENIAFATLLFCVYFVAACLFIYDPSKAMNRRQSIPVAPGQLDLFNDVEPQNISQDLWESQTPTSEEPFPSSLIPCRACEADLQNAANYPLYAQALHVIDNLGKREARKVMGGLKLQQKRNGVELSTELMVASIKREFKASPESVIEVIRDRLPERQKPPLLPEQLAG